MIRACLLLCFLLSSQLWAQSAAEDVIERSFGLELSPHTGNNRVSAGVNTTQLELERIDSLEQSRFGYGLGLVYESRNARIGFTTGLRYTQTGYETLQQPGPADVPFSDEVTAHYLSLPFELNFYQNITERDRALFMMGVAGQYHLGTTVERTFFRPGQESETMEFEDENLIYRSLILSFSTGIAYDRKLSDRWALRVQPTFQFFLNGNLQPEGDIIANRNYYQLGGRVVIRRLF